MDGVRSRGVLVSIASFIFSSFGLALSVVGSLLDLSFGHDAVAHLLAMAAGQPHKQSDLQLPSRNRLHPLDATAARHRTRSPSPSRKHQHHKHLPQPASILRNASSSSSLNHDNTSPDRLQQADRRQSDGAADVTLSTTRARSPIPTIAIHEPDAHSSAASSDAAAVPVLCKSKKLRSKFGKSSSKRDTQAGSDSEHRSNSDSSSSDRRIGNHHQSSPPSPTRSLSSRPALPRSQSAYASDSEAAGLGRAPSLRKRTPSITFLQPIRPSKDATQESQTGGSSEGRADGSASARRPNAPQIPPLGTSLSEFKRSQHRKGLSRCSSSPNLSTPPATPTDFDPSSDSSSRSTSTSTFVIVPPAPLEEPQHQDKENETAKSKTADRRPTTPSRKMTLSSMLRKIPSAPGPLLPDAEKTSKIFAFAFSSNSATKKGELKTRRSQPSLSTRTTSPSPPPLPAPKPLRTQPYEAPYFCATPDSVVVQPKPARRKAKDGEVKTSSTTKSPMGSRVSSPDLSAARVLTASP